MDRRSRHGFGSDLILHYSVECIGPRPRPRPRPRPWLLGGRRGIVAVVPLPGGLVLVPQEYNATLSLVFYASVDRKIKY